MPTQQIDEGDQQVQYSSGWSLDASPESFGNSLHGSAEPGSTATLTFTGTGVEVHGIVRNTNQHPTMAFTVDGSAGRMDYVAPTIGKQNAMTFFFAQGLSSGQHRLVITNQDGGDPIALWLDFFLVTSPQDPPTSTVSTIQDKSTLATAPAKSPSTSSHTTSTAPNANSTQSIPASTVSQSSSDSISNPTAASGSGVTGKSSNASHSSRPPSSEPTSLPSQSAATRLGNTPAIVGGVVGSVISLFLLGVVLFFIRRGRRKRVGKNGVQPFMISATRSSLLHGSQYMDPSRWSSRALNASSPSTPLETATLYVGPSSVIATNHTPRSDHTSTDEHFAGEGPLESVLWSPTPPYTEDKVPTPIVLSGRNSTAPIATSTEPNAPSPNTPLPSDIGQALSHASPDLRFTALNLLRSLLQQNQSQTLLRQAVEVDSGLRIVDEDNMTPPPEYTTE